MNNEIFRVLKKEELAQVAGGVAAETGETHNQCHKDGKNDVACAAAKPQSARR